MRGGGMGEERGSWKNKRKQLGARKLGRELMEGQ